VPTGASVRSAPATLRVGASQLVSRDIKPLQILVAKAWHPPFRRNTEASVEA